MRQRGANIMGLCSSTTRTLSIRRVVPLLSPAYTTTRRHRSTDASTAQDQNDTAALSPRWLSDMKQRIGKCITFGLQPAQVAEAGLILQEISRDWRELLCGSDGFLTSPTRRGLYRHRVVWGEEDSMVCSVPILLYGQR
jgi:hypothetical protein